MNRASAGWRRLAVGVVVVLGAAAVTVTSLPKWDAPAPVEHVDEAPDTAAALTAAHRQGEAVTVADLTTPTRVVAAQPDGTLTAEINAVPVRVRKDGKWADADPALVDGAGGLVPKAAGVDVVLSKGGNGPLLTIGTPKRSVALTWPGELPAPVVEGATATYRDVLPGVDLVLRTQASGVTHHVVVKDAKAKPQSIRFGLTHDGLTVRATREGGLEAVDGEGEVVLGTPPTIMWDAAGKQAKVGLAVDATSLTLLPDQELLTTGQYPVTIDPDWWTNDRKDWTKVFSGKPDSIHWYGGNDVDTWAKVGTCNGWDFCGGVNVARSYFQFNTDFLRGKRIISADFNATVVYGPSCNTRDHELWIANDTFGSGTSWNNAPGGTYVDTSPAGANYEGCAGYKPVGFSVGQFINPNGWSAYFIKAANEGDKYAWRKYDAAGTKIVVNYNTRPNPPVELVTDPPLTACRWCGGVPYVGDDFIRLKGKLTDAENDQLTAVWDVYGGVKTHVEGPTMRSGNVFSTTVDLRDRHDQNVTWTLWGRDPANDGGDWKNGPGFKVDRIGIDKAPNVTGVLYQEDNRWHGGAGVPGRFTFDAAGVSDVDHYLYGWNDPPSTKVDADALGGKAVLDIAPPGDGPRDLYVQSVDRAGHRSPTKKVHIYVRAGNGPLAQWSFDGNARDSAFLGDRHATLTGGASYTASGAVGSALQLDGGTGYASAPNTVRTDTSLSVSVWAKVDNGTGSRAIVSQDGNRFAGFTLWYRPDDGGRWVFAMVNPDASDKWADTAWSATTAQLGVWTHLTAVYDAPANELRLYVNGVLSDTQKRLVAPVNSTGELRVGRTQWDSNPGLDHLAGAVDELKVYDRILSESEIRSVVSRDSVQVGHWKFDDGEGATAANAVAGGTAGVLQGKAKFVGDGAVGGAVKFEDTTGHVTTGQPAVRTDQSFTVSAWVRQEQELAPGHPSGAVTQEGSVMSAFYLGYRQRMDGGGNWEFVLPTEDAKDKPAEGVWSTSRAKIGDWTHLTGVYDAQARQIRLYVNGELEATASRTKGFNATGPLMIGRGKWHGDTGFEWRGSLDEVRVFSRAVAPEEVRGIVSRDSVAAGSWRFDGNLQDSSALARHGTPVGATAYVGGQSSMPDPNDLALRLDGASAVSTPHAVDLDRSFAVAAWARADENKGLTTVVSQDGANVSGFKVRAREDGKWGFVMFAKDGTDSARDEAVGGAVQIGQWTHLVAVYDASAKQVLLYVNGVLASSVPHAHTWNAAGGVQIGRAKWGAPVEYFKGSIDDVSVYSRALFAAEIQAMAGRDLTLAHNYPFDEGSGRNAADAAGSRPVTLAGDAAFAPGRVGNGVTFAGTGSATASGVDVRLDQAFTVSAWVRLGEKTCDARVCRMDAVTVDGPTASKFRLGHVIDDDNSQLGAWTFEMPEQDNGRVTKAAVSTLPSETDQWTFLVGVYDPTSKKMWLYVNGTRVGDGTLGTAWQATGALAIGRGKEGGTAAAQWKGGVDDVRLYTGQLDKDRITGLYRSYPAQQGATTLPVADAGHWKLNDNGDDASGRDQRITFQGGTGWGGGMASAAATFDGTTGYGGTSAGVVDTGQSFSVSAWAFLTDTGSGNRTVLAQDAARQSAFSLAYHGVSKKWAVLATGADTDNAAVAVLTSGEAATPFEWTHLTLSYDANLKQVRLYVNGLLSGAQTGITVLPSSGPLTFGRAKVNGANAAFHRGSIDDPRVYSKAVSDGEARRIHDDMPDRDLAFYRFDDGAAKDITWRKATASLSTGTGFGAGVSGKALQLDGVAGTAVTPSGLSMRDSFTVAAWAKLDRTDRVATIASQDGDRNSGFVLQYRPDLQRWVFGAAASDTDNAQLTYVASSVPPKAGEWTHVNGVYDYAARQLRLYLNGELAGTRNNVVLWQATGNVVLGREKVNGSPSGFFTGAVDEVRYGAGVPADQAVAERGRWAASGQGRLGRFVNASGDRFTGNTSAVVEGYHLERALGLPAVEGPNTSTAYACRSGADTFTSLDAACEGATKIGDVGLVYTRQPANIPTIPLYRCRAGTDRFDSRDSTCGGSTVDGVLGHSVAYADFGRYLLWYYEHASLTDGPAPGYVAEGRHGLLALTAQPGTRPLYSCRNGSYDQFVSTDAACEGKTVLSTLGSIWTEAPEGLESRALYRCTLPGGDGDGMVSNAENCEGHPAERLGYALTAAPGVTAVFE
ncbi:LamG domain-containing protein [Lentzea sp. BCCO 10_0061]|uniref:LamG domain-containing protein n=1 Tax=Lentzea sokolovensis TaxID=3095429 RepID=A0ABU4V6S6_9PSEU|nr:LamG domain-containing protein [Lentzea sp. BCCO 10_0061]MDX8146929.1 LamG domain-containing protein [Lentzea sp. BCCO 10_0061]